MSKPKLINKTSDTNQASFRCLNCHALIPNVAQGTKHRNHCPICLWSKHLDLKIPGDRRSSCGAKMKPIGLAFKNNDTELLIVHLCLGCGKISGNRIAGDDNSYAVVNLLDLNYKQDGLNIKLLAQENKHEVLTALFGKDYIE